MRLYESWQRLLAAAGFLNEKEGQSCSDDGTVAEDPLCQGAVPMSMGASTSAAATAALPVDQQGT